jgi:hypothetical protein
VKVIKVEIDAETVKRLVVAELQRTMGDIEVDPERVTIEVQRTEKRREWQERNSWSRGSEPDWEQVVFRAIYQTVQS